MSFYRVESYIKCQIFSITSYIMLFFNLHSTSITRSHSRSDMTPNDKRTKQKKKWTRYTWQKKCRSISKFIQYRLKWGIFLERVFYYNFFIPSPLFCSFLSRIERAQQWHLLPPVFFSETIRYGRKFFPEFIQRILWRKTGGTKPPQRLPCAISSFLHVPCRIAIWGFATKTGYEILY